jgi:hypothetical protein
MNTSRTQRQLAEVGATVTVTRTDTGRWRAEVTHSAFESEYSWHPRNTRIVVTDTLFGLQFAIRRALAPLRRAKKAREVTELLNTPVKS